MTLRRLTALTFLLAAATSVSACSPVQEGLQTQEIDEEDPEAPVPDPETTTPDKAKAVLELVPMDLWGQPLPADGASLTVGDAIGVDGFSPGRIYLDSAGTFVVKLAAPHHEELEVRVDFDGTESLRAAVIGSVEQGHGAAMTHAVETVEGREVVVHRVFLGLRHRWFSAQGRPARRGNRVDVYLDGERAWKSVHADMQAATSEVLAASWWWESDFELVRDPSTHMDLTPSARWKNTMLGTLESNSATVRVLVGQFWGQDGILSSVNVDSDLLAYADQAADGIEFMGQANETEGTFLFEVAPFSFVDRLASRPDLAGTEFDAGELAIESTVPSRQVDLTEWPIDLEVQAASYHQKFSVIDHEVTYIGGMNVKAADWDTSEHRVFDARRMGFDATASEREAVSFKEADSETGPRKDYFVRVEGPSAQDAADIFKRRWDHTRELGVEYSENASSFEVQREIAPRNGGVQVQVTATLPEPFWEHAIAETWFNAVRNAERFILIEDQYFRVPMLNEAIVERMEEMPDLELVVITKPVNEWTDPGCAQTYLADELFKSTFPGRYTTLQLRAFDTVETWGFEETESRFVDIDVHSKVLIVDDVFASIGSANKNNRGIVYEGELNVAIVDEAKVTALRREMLANLLPGWSPTDAAPEWVSDLRAAALQNDAVYAAWEAEGGDLSLDGAALPASLSPRGFVYSLDFGVLSACLLESVGPDMTGEAGPTSEP
jgi:phosphatidylserine/phosphatidylglycerophosphate/cardiolipin synthase-like enzyme